MTKGRGSAALPCSPTSPSLSLLGPAPILPGEDWAAYEELLAQAFSTVRPAGLIEEVWLHDYVHWIWDIRRMRLVKDGLLRGRLTRALRETLASYYEFTEEEIQGLVERWTARKPAAIKEVERLLRKVNLTVDVVLARAFCKKLDELERIDRLLTSAEGRRNAMLREIERHRASFAQRLRENAHRFEDLEIKKIQKIESGSILADDVGR